MRWYADNSDFISTNSGAVPDSFLLCGFAIAQDDEGPLRNALQQVKTDLGVDPHAPVKWNLRDLERDYKEIERLHVYNRLKDTANEWRVEMFRAAAQFDIKVIASCVGSYSVRRDHLLAKRAQFCGFMLCNALMRFAMHAREANAKSAEVVLDWPERNYSVPFDLEYASAYSRGEARYSSGSGMRIKYYGGPLKDQGFSDAICYAHARNSVLLQFADLIAGAVKEVCKAANGRSHNPLAFDALRVVRERIRGYPDNIVGRGVSIQGGHVAFRANLEKVIARRVLS